MNEFRCLKCGETFVVPDETLRDTSRLRIYHDLGESGQECGGVGKLAALWQTKETAKQNFLEVLFARERGRG